MNIRSNNDNLAFTEIHHAILFALMAKYITQFFKEDGELIIRAAIRHYGEQRGSRMAMRAKVDGKNLSFLDYLVYGEWEPSDPAATQSVTKEEYPDLKTIVKKCPWNSAWLEFDLLEYGRLYCQEIDKALVKGFNPQLTIEVSHTMTNLGDTCEFIYCDASSGNKISHTTILELQGKSQEKNTMDWEYHCGHLYKIFSEIILDELGDVGQKALQAALNDFIEYFGKEYYQALLGYQEMDFDNLPTFLSE